MKLLSLGSFLDISVLQRPDKIKFNMPPKPKTRRKGTESVSEMDAWQCKTYNKTYGNIDDKVLECDKCHEHLCTTCINMPDQVYDYMCQPEVIW